MILLKGLDKVSGCARSIPIRCNFLRVQSLHQTERVKHILRMFAEMIAVVVTSQRFQARLIAHAKRLTERLHIGLHRRSKLRKAYAAERRILVEHADVLEVVQLTEDAELRKLGNASDEHKLQVRVEQLNGAVEVLHGLAKRQQVLFLVHHVEQRCVILVDDNHRFPPGLLMRLLHQVFQPYVRVYLWLLYPYTASWS